MKATTSRIWCATLALLSASALFSGMATAQGLQPPVFSSKSFVASGVHSVKETDSLSATQTLPSPSTALKVSLVGTFAPIAAGVAVLAIQKPERVTYYQDQYGSYYYLKDPDRTLPLVLIATGVLIGPSAGYFYGDCADRGAKGLLIRGLIAGATIATATSVAESVQSDEFLDFSGVYAGLAIGAAGAGFIVTDVVYDLCKVKPNVLSRNNQRLAPRVGLVPGFSPSSGTPTLQLRVTF